VCPGVPKFSVCFMSPTPVTVHAGSVLVDFTGSGLLGREVRALMLAVMSKKKKKCACDRLNCFFDLSLLGQNDLAPCSSADTTRQAERCREEVQEKYIFCADIIFYKYSGVYSISQILTISIIYNYN